MSYFPLDRDLLTSSTWATGTPEQIKVWLYLLLAADPRSGLVEDTAPALALRCGLPLDVAQEALAWLAAPDEHSRTRSNEGRRIAFTDGGILVLNYLSRQNKDHSTPRVQRYRERLRNAETVRNSVSPFRGNAGNDEQEQEHEHRERQQTPASSASSKPPKGGRKRRQKRDVSQDPGTAALVLVAAPVVEVLEPGAWPGNWPGRLHDVLAGEGVEIAPGQIGAHLKPLRGRYDLAVVEAALVRWARAGRASYGLPVFLREIGQWAGTAAPADMYQQALAELTTAGPVSLPGGSR